LSSASTVGGTRLAPALRLGIKQLGPLTGDRVMGIFSDGGLSDWEESIALARQLCAMGVRIVVRGLGHGAATALAKLACQGHLLDTIRSRTVHRPCEELENACDRVPRTPRRASQRHPNHHITGILPTRLVNPENNALAVARVEPTYAGWSRDSGRGWAWPFCAWV
jgi:hypothetical protein